MRQENGLGRRPPSPIRSYMTKLMMSSWASGIPLSGRPRRLPSRGAGGSDRTAIVAQREDPLAKYRIATPAGASFTVAGGGYGYELEALTPIDAEIYEIPPGSEDDFVAAAKDAD